MKHLALLLTAGLAGCATVRSGPAPDVTFHAGDADHARDARAAGLPAEYARLGLRPNEIQPWEDGLRTDPAVGSYEWWYFDGHLDDQSKLVIVFYTKNLASPSDPLTPAVSFSLDRPDGTKITKEVQLTPAQFSAAKSGCDVHIGPNRFSGDLHHYAIHVEIGDIKADVRLDAEVPPWRPGTGYMYFGDKDEKYFAWLPSVPQGRIDASISIGGKTEQHGGSGYHDHNWGNISILEIINHWYWARAQVKDFTVVASFITAEKAYGGESIPIFMLARNGQIIADDSRKVSFEARDVAFEPVTGKPVANTVVYRYDAGDQHYVVTFRRKRDLVLHRMVDDLTGFRRFAAGLIGFDGAYLRFTGDVQIERLENGKVVESLNDQALWELMYLGKYRGP